MTIESQGNYFERRCSMTGRISGMTAKPVHLPNLMIVAYVSSDPACTCIIHTRDDELLMVTDECSIPLQCDKFNSDCTINVVRYKPPERCHKQMLSHNTVKPSVENSKTCWREYLTLPDDYFAYSDKFFNILTQFESTWDGRFGSIKTVQNQTELGKTDNPSTHSAPYRAGSKAREFE